ncbi:MAG: hypothetical protein ACOYMA_01785 [Bacteroidia bacterium]
MLASDQQEKIAALYTNYNEVIRPLISEIEARQEVFPAPLFNEIRAFNDHIARCHLKCISVDKIVEEIKKAEGHINRITLDCFKYLDVFLFEKVKRFERSTRYIDISVLDNGKFYPSFCRLQKEAVQHVREAKKAEATDIESSLNYYQLAYNSYCELEEKIDDKSVEIRWAKVRFTSKKLLQIILWTLAAILSGLVSLFLTCDQVKLLLTGLFN